MQPKKMTQERHFAFAAGLGIILGSQGMGTDWEPAGSLALGQRSTESKGGEPGHEMRLRALGEEAVARGGSCA